MLESRSVTSGATGRNGGHINLPPHVLFARMAKRFGKEKARKIVRFQMKHLDLLVGLNIEVGEARKVEAVDLFMDDQSFQTAKGAVKVFKDGMPDEAREIRVYERSDAIKVRSDHRLQGE